ncbi:MAG: hypothetical protein M3X11_02430 [Acidobacteriota bacterium]|nr:hypothetical protein [Acidobacteriota bacterium]
MSEEPEIEDLPEKVSQAYRRAAIGLAIGAIGWTLAILFANDPDEQPVRWLIPITAAAISVLCFSRYRKAKESQE